MKKIRNRFNGRAVGRYQAFVRQYAKAQVGKAIDALKDETVYSITPDLGKEFSKHDKITAALGFEFYFPLPHQPWQRGTNENTNGLLREYFPKS